LILLAEQLRAAMKTVTIRTSQRTELVEIRNLVQNAIDEAGLRTGAVVVYSPHTTAAITIQENADPDVVHDMLLWLNSAIPKDVRGFRHAEGNSDSHLKASLVGPSVIIPVEEGKLTFGTWQGVYFCEFDGPRTRRVRIQMLSDGSRT
jgi:secondary thiamine-phosphate synthase enzyme